MSENSIKILLFLAQGFEDLEAISIIDVFGWTQYREDIKKASVITTGFHPVVIDDRIISCSGPGSAIDVAFLLMEQLMGSKTIQEVRKFMIYKNG